MRLQRHSSGERISITPSNLMGAGGEARVYAVPPEQILAAKLYHRPSETHRRKLQAMIENPPENPTGDQAHNSIAWPVDLLSTAHGDRLFVGYLMRRAAGMRPLFQVYNPSVRRQTARFADYRFLHRAARNLAAAVRALHARGYVIGDVNESNMLVSETALVTLVDTDSFQVTSASSGSVYRCPVGKAEFTPPELQGKRFRTLDRSPEHDCFGLAVLIFQLLMEGTHPFAGLYSGVGDPPAYDARIARGHFAYGNRPGPYRPLPVAPPFELVDPTLRHLFLRCFEDGHSHPAARPDAQTWQNALSQAERSLVICSENQVHRYGGHLSECPWCRRRVSLGGRDPFPGVSDVQEQPRRRVATRSLRPTPVPAPLPAGPSRASAAVTNPSWQNSAPLSASVYGGGSQTLPVPTLFTLRLSDNIWAWGAGLWAIMAIAAAPLGLFGLNWIMAVLSIGCGVMGWRTGVRIAGFSRWASALSSICACLSLALHPLTAAPALSSAALSAGTGGVRALTFSPDGSRLAVGTGRQEDSSLTEGAVNIWDVASGRLILTPERASGDVVSVAYSPDGGLLIAGTDSPFGSGEVVLLNPSVNGAYRTVWKQRGHLRQVAWSPDGRLFASAGAERLVRIWNARTLEIVQSIPTPGIASSIAFSPGSDLVAVGTVSPQGSVAPGYVSVWDIATGRSIWSRRAHGNGVQEIVYDPHGRLLASCGSDAAICLWDASSGRLVRRQTARSYRISGLAFSRDGAQLASSEMRSTETGSINEIVLRNGATAAPIRALPPTPDAPSALAFSPAGGMLASGSGDGTVRLWRLPRK